MELGFIGTGTMGLPMVTQLSKAGHRIRAFDLSPNALNAAAQLEGVTPTTSPAQAASGAQVLITCLPNDAVVRETYLGAKGVLTGGDSGLITCDASTVTPETTLAVAAGLHARGIRHMDIPMLGSQPQAISGELFFIVGGDASDLEVIKPLLVSMGRMHMAVGALGMGNRIKLIHNALGAVNAVAVAESLALCLQTEVNPTTFYEVVRKGGGMAYSTYFERRVARMIGGDFSPTFTAALMHKDVSLAKNMAEGMGLRLPILEEAQRTYTEAVERGWGGEDFSAVTHVMEQRMGHKISGKG